MRAYLSLTPVGIMAFGDDGKLINLKSFQFEPSVIVQKIRDILDGKLISELDELINELVSKKYYIILTELEELLSAIKQSKFQADIKLILEKNSDVFRTVRDNLENLIVDYTPLKNSNEVTSFLNNLCLVYTKEKIKRSSERKDLIIIQAIEALDDLDKNINLYVSRLKEWYSLYFPELGQLISNPETYTKLISKFGVKEKFTSEDLEKLGLPTKRIELILNSLKKSIGGDFDFEDINPIILFARMIEVQYETRNTLEKYIEQIMEETAPNIKGLVGATLGARLISLAGGLENLSKMPASTIQVLGAEKALFTSLKSGSPPPKHGIIFQHGLIHNAPKWQRGKIARALAGKLSIASRLDYFSSNINEELLISLEKRINEIRKKYSQPPPEKKKKISKKKYGAKFSKKKKKRKKRGK
ncbi:MAG: C/D box methylation guide ribonucleoprotein complex aNOP56 subunit [Candidatus Odinarchaeia archaeon]